MIGGYIVVAANWRGKQNRLHDYSSSENPTSPVEALGIGRDASINLQLRIFDER